MVAGIDLICDHVLPILDSIIERGAECALKYLMFPRNWRRRNNDTEYESDESDDSESEESFHAFLTRYNDFLVNREFSCQKCSCNLPAVHDEEEGQFISLQVYYGTQKYTCYDCMKHFCVACQGDNDVYCISIPCKCCERLYCLDCKTVNFCNCCSTWYCADCDDEFTQCSQCEQDVCGCCVSEAGCRDCGVENSWCDRCVDNFLRYCGYYCFDCSSFCVVCEE